MATQLDTAVLDGLAGDLDTGYGAFVRAHSGAVYSAALRLSGSSVEADDLAQETFVRAYRALQGYDPDRVRALESRAWLLTITLNLWRNHVRRASRRPREAGSVVPDVPDPRPGPEASAEAMAQSGVLVGLLRDLPERHRVPVVLRYVVGLSYAEIASVLDCPVGTAKANVARGLDRLRTLACSSPAPPVPARQFAPAQKKSENKKSEKKQQKESP